MALSEPVIRGALAGHPAAPAFAREVQRVHHRYATEVVGAFRLCPFMKDPDTAFGHFCVMLDGAPSPEGALAAVLESTSSVIHLVFPCVREPSSKFERFAASVRDSLISYMPKPPVMAVFHPELAGDFSTSHRLVGLVRRAPDPFIQLIPEGLHEGGTVFIDSIENLTKSPTDQTYARLKEKDRAQIIASIQDIHADRAASYAPHLEALGRAPQ